MIYSSIYLRMQLHVYKYPIQNIIRFLLNFHKYLSFSSSFILSPHVLGERDGGVMRREGGEGVE